MDKSKYDSHTKTDINYQDNYLITKLLNNPIIFIKDHINPTPAVHISIEDSLSNQLSNLSLNTETNSKSSFVLNFPEITDAIKNFELKLSTKIKHLLTNKFNNNKSQNANSNSKSTYNKENSHHNLDGIDSIDQLINSDLNALIMLLSTYEYNTEFYNCVKESMNNIFNDIFFKKHWNILSHYQRNFINEHIFITILFMYYDCKHSCNNKNRLSEYDINILLWTMLFHDICKYVTLNKSLNENFSQNPEVNDPAHPFKSAALSLRLFFENNFFELTDYNKKNKENESDKINHKDNTKDNIDKKNDDYHSFEYVKTRVDLLYDVLIKSMKANYKHNNQNVYIHSFDKIDLIMSTLNELRSDKNNWIIDVVFLIMTHQSLDNITIKRNKPAFSEDQIKKFYDKRLLELSLFVYVNDSLSYTLFAKNGYIKDIVHFQDRFRKYLGYS